MKSLESQPWPVELGRKKSRRRLQDRVRAFELGILPFQPLDLGRLLTADPGPRSLIDLVLADPLQQRLRRADAQQICHMRHLANNGFACSSVSRWSMRRGYVWLGYT